MQKYWLIMFSTNWSDKKGNKKEITERKIQWRKEFFLFEKKKSSIHGIGRN